MILLQICIWNLAGLCTESAVIRLEGVKEAMTAVDRALFVPEGKISQICDA